MITQFDVYDVEYKHSGACAWHKTIVIKPDFSNVLYVAIDGDIADVGTMTMELEMSCDYGMCRNVEHRSKECVSLDVGDVIHHKRIVYTVVECQENETMCRAISSSDYREAEIRSYDCHWLASMKLLNKHQ